MDIIQSKNMAKQAIRALEDKKAEDIHVIDISEVSVVADYFIIANGSNRSQIQAMADNVQDVLGRSGYMMKQVEGYNTANWILETSSCIFLIRKIACSIIWSVFGGMAK